MLGLTGCAHSGAAVEAPAASEAQANATEQAPATSVQAPTPDRPLLLWQLDKDGQTSHLLGTCHLALPLDQLFDQQHATTLQQARVLYIEAQIDDLDPVDMMRMVWREGPGLSEQLEPHTWQALSHGLRNVVPAPLLDRMHPWVVEVMAMFPPTIDGAGKPAPSMDKQVATGARSQGAEVRYLETLEQQFEMMSQQEVDLDVWVQGSGELDDSWHATRALCLEAQTEPFERLLSGEDSDEYEAVFFQRNLAWAETLTPVLSEGGVVVAVGAGHMIGDRGLVALLEAEGYTATRLQGPWPDLSGMLPQQAPQMSEPPEVDPDLLADVASNMAPMLVSGMCQPGQPVRACFTRSEQHCQEGMAHGMALCIDQYAADIAAGEADVQARISTCAPAALLAEAIAQDRVGASPMCAMMLGAMRAATQ